MKVGKDGSVRFELRIHPTLTIAEVLELHRLIGNCPFDGAVCLCGFHEDRLDWIHRDDPLDLHRAEVLWGAFRIEAFRIEDA